MGFGLSWDTVEIETIEGRCEEMTTSIRCGKEIPLAFKKDDKLTINGIDNVVVAVYDNIASWEIVAVAVITSPVSTIAQPAQNCCPFIAWDQDPDLVSGEYRCELHGNSSSEKCECKDTWKPCITTIAEKARKDER